MYSYWKLVETQKSVKKSKIIFSPERSIFSFHVTSLPFNYSFANNEQFFPYEMQNNQLILSKKLINFIWLFITPKFSTILNDVLTEGRKKFTRWKRFNLRQEKITHYILNKSQGKRSKKLTSLNHLFQNIFENEFKN